MAKNKIALMINTLNIHGPGKIVFGILKNIDCKKFDVCLVTLMRGNNDRMIKELSDKITVKEFNCKNKLSFFFNKKMIIRYMNGLNCNVIHSHGIMPDYINKCVNTNAKKIATIHNNPYEDFSNRFNRVLSKIMIKNSIRNYKAMDLNVCCSRSVYDALKNTIDNIAYVNNGADFDCSDENKIARKNIRRKNGLKDSDIVFIFAGDLIPRKNIPELIRLFKKCHANNEYLLIVGRGEEYSNCVIEAESDANVKVLGFKENIKDYFLASDVYVSNSVSEGMSVSCIEAMACGNYLLLSDIDSHRGFFENSSNCYIGELFNNSNFDKRMLILRSHFVNRCSDREAIINYHNDYFSSMKMADGYQKTYCDVIGDIYEK